jgi:hypothetical protein
MNYDPAGFNPGAVTDHKVSTNDFLEDMEEKNLQSFTNKLIKEASAAISNVNLAGLPLNYQRSHNLQKGISATGRGGAPDLSALALDEPL